MTSGDVDRFAELLSSRLCHDLISPIGAVNNGLELAAEGGAENAREALSLIGASAHQASARLGFFRLAFGAWGTEPTIGFGVIRRAVDDLFRDHRCKVLWDTSPADDEPVAKSVGKLLLNLILVASECSLRAGQLRVVLSLSEKGPKIVIVVESERWKLRDEVREGMANALESSSLTVQNVIAQHCRRLADVLSLDLHVAERSASSLEFAAKMP